MYREVNSVLEAHHEEEDGEEAEPGYCTEVKCAHSRQNEGLMT